MLVNTSSAKVILEAVQGIIGNYLVSYKNKFVFLPKELQTLNQWNVHKYSLTGLKDEKSKLEKEAKKEKFPESEIPKKL